ncbi:hypothetical protein L484_021655 [Morus notabilis]|uniref:Uncharacterized protein n=1 Tax=Morus notabilis TaxID=981085 RepID=W9S6R0_9ROSA|nr:hypothetical protein L484_021655 [Morus notabilis]
MEINLSGYLIKSSILVLGGNESRNPRLSLKTHYLVILNNLFKSATVIPQDDHRSWVLILHHQGWPRTGNNY